MAAMELILLTPCSSSLCLGLMHRRRALQDTHSEGRPRLQDRNLRQPHQGAGGAAAEAEAGARHLKVQLSVLPLPSVS